MDAVIKAEFQSVGAFYIRMCIMAKSFLFKSQRMISITV